MKKTEIFTRTPVRNVSRNMFDLSHEVKMSGKFAMLYPCLIQEAMPGDSLQNVMTALVRFAPMLAPVMHKMTVKTDAFFVPMRLIAGQTSWENFITGGQNGTTEVVLPYITPNGIKVAQGSGAQMMKGQLWDYFGLPVIEGVEPVTMNTEHISLLPFKAYTKIWNDWFRDPNFDTEIDMELDVVGDRSAGPLTAEYLGIRERGWEREAFTGALPWAQRGATVLMPLAGTGRTVAHNVIDGDVLLQKTLDQSAADPGNLEGNTFMATTALTDVNNNPISIVGQKVEVDASSVSINDFRTALAIQRWLENNARGGGRYNEQIRSHYGRNVPDYRLQRSEYLGGGRQVVQISQVLSTAEADDVPVGDMAGHGISVGKSNRWKYTCDEHGYVIMILSVVPAPAYVPQGIEKFWQRESRYDFAFPEFANLGEEEILSKQIFYDFADSGDAANNALFGYNPRYWDYKFKQDRVAGDFRDDLLFWHLSRKFSARPQLDSQFVTMTDTPAEEEPLTRIFNVTGLPDAGADYLWMQLFHKFTALRPLPYFGVPELKG